MQASAVGRNRAGAGVRVAAFDLARGLAVLFMILVHVLWHWGAPETWATPLGVAISFLGGPPAAPVFMFLMGASMAFSTRTSFGSLVRRGLTLVALGYVLNVLRGWLPATLGLATGVITADEVAPFTPLWLLTTVDILQMAGLAVLAMAVLREVVRPGGAWLALAVGVVLVAPVVRGITDDVPILGAILTPVWGGAPNVYYAVFPWLVFPLVGGVVGARLASARGAKSQVAELRRIGLIGAGLLVVGVALIVATKPTLDVRTYWEEPPVLALAIVGFVLAWTWLCGIVARRLAGTAAVRLVIGWSRQVTAMYFVHWIIVGWGIGIVGFRALELPAVVAAMVVAVALTLVVSSRVDRLRHWHARAGVDAS